MPENGNLDGPRIETSTLNYVTPAGVFCGMDPKAVSDMARDAGFRGAQYHPMRRPLTPRDVLNSSLAELVTSGHQSWNGGNFFLSRESLKVNPAVILGTAILMQGSMESLKTLGLMQQHLHRKLSVVLYPSRGGDEAEYCKKAGFSELVFQPKPGLLRILNIRNDADDVSGICAGLRIRGEELGLSICLDTFHWRSGQNGNRLPPWQEALPYLVPDIAEVHVGLGRTEFPFSKINSVHELCDMITGEPNETADMLGALRENGLQGQRVVLEVPAASLVRCMRERAGGKISRDEALLQGHEKLVKAVRGMLSAPHSAPHML